MAECQPRIMDVGVVLLNASIAVAGMLAVVFSGSAFSAKPLSKPVHKPKDLSV